MKLSWIYIAVWLHGWFRHVKSQQWSVGNFTCHQSCENEENCLRVTYTCSLFVDKILEAKEHMGELGAGCPKGYLKIKSKRGEQKCVAPKRQLTTQRGKQSHGVSCKASNECSVPGSICHNETCLCPVGIYYSQSQNACIKKCDKYANMLDVYTSVGIISHNFIKNATWEPTACFERCLNETKITCVSVESHVWRCHVYEMGFLDVPEKNRRFYKIGVSDQSLHPMAIEEAKHEHFFGQRQCQ